MKNLLLPPSPPPPPSGHKMSYKIGGGEKEIFYFMKIFNLNLEDECLGEYQAFEDYSLNGLFK